MTTYGPWVQPDDTEAAPSTLWYRNTADSQGTTVPNTDPTAFAGSVAAAVAGTGTIPPPSPMTAGLSTSALAPMTQASKVDLPGSNAAAVARATLLAPNLAALSYPPVPPEDVPSRAVGYEYEAIAGEPVSGTLRVYGYAVISATSSGNQVGVRLNRLTASDYTLDGLGRPQAAWSTVLSSGSTVVTFPPPAISATYRVDAFELTDQALDVNDRAVYTLVDLFLDSAWLLDESSNGQLRNDAPLSPPAAGTLPWFTQTYTPPRYRFLYDVDPPLRQFPRGDSLVGTGGSRQRGAGSRQASNRQGWAGTYL